MRLKHLKEIKNNFDQDENEQENNLKINELDKKLLKDKFNMELHLQGINSIEKYMRSYKKITEMIASELEDHDPDEKERAFLIQLDEFIEEETKKYLNELNMHLKGAGMQEIGLDKKKMDE